MKLIAESGSTKTDWVIIKGNKVIDRQQSPGINPFFQTTQEIVSSIQFLRNIAPIDEIHFYGAGCANAEKNQIIINAFSEIQPKANCHVASDLLAAAHALCGTSEGIACIMGTGSNSCHFNGKEIVTNISPLGFILGDEGSGAVLGKKLISDILKDQAPTEITEAFFCSYDFSPAQIINRVYREAFPNRFLAQFTLFLKQNISHTYIRNMVLNSFNDFFTRNILQYSDCKKLPIHFTGSIAFHFQSELKQIASQFGLTIGTISQSPLQGLIDYHTKK